MNKGRKKERRSRRFYRSCCAAAAGAVVLLAAAGYTLAGRALAERETYVYKEETVNRGDLYKGVMESGSILAEPVLIRYELELATEEEEDTEEESSGEEEQEDEEASYLELETVFAVPGQYVDEGDPLFAFTQDSLEKVRRRLKAAVGEKEAAVLEAQSSLQEELLTAKNEQDRAKLLAARAESTYQAQLVQAQENVNGMQARIAVLTQELESCQAKLADGDFDVSRREARQALEQAQKKWEDTDTHNTAAYTANYSAYLSAKEAFDALEQQAAGWQETVDDNTEEIGRLKEKIEEGTAGLAEKELEASQTKEEAVTDGRLSEQIYDYTARALEITAAGAQKELEEAEKTLAAFEAFIGEEGILTAPEAGRVLTVDYAAGDQLKEQGTMLTLAGEKAYTVSVDVSEEDIAGISVGDSVRVELNAYKGEEWDGTVSAVTTTRTSEHANTVSYPVNIILSGDPTRLFEGMTAEITFVESSAQAVLYVSQKAVLEQADGDYVYISDGSGEKRLQKVVCGFTNGTDVEIKSGLKEGQTVYIRSRGKAQEAAESE